ncbi:MAG: hypothetical protein ACTHN0_13935 [Aquihabitans sp.]
MSDEAHPTGRTCEWCGSPKDHDGRAVCPSCGRLASRLAAMDDVEAPAAPAPTEPVMAPVPPPPPPPSGPAPRPAAPRPAPPASAPHAPSNGDETASHADGPVAPGGRWPTPAPLPPDDDAGRPWWKIAVPVVAVLVLVGAVAAFTMGGGGGDDGSGSTAAPTVAQGTGKVDLSGVEDPAVTTTRPTTTTTEATSTTVVTADGRYLTESESGIRWSMAAAPEISSADGGRASTWQAVDGRTTELVEITDLDGASFDADAALAAAAQHFGAELDAIANSHIEEAPGRTASFKGTLDGKPMAGYVVAAQVGDQSLVMTMVEQGDDLDGLYVAWLSLPSSVKLP